MGLDIRLPIGLLFSLIGILLVGFGALSDKAIYARSLNYNINLLWSAALLLFGVVMLTFGYVGGHKARVAKQHHTGDVD